MFLRHNLPGMLWAVFILMLIGLPGKNIPNLSLWVLLTPDKIFHTLIFSVFTLLLTIGFAKQHSFYFLFTHSKTASLLIGIVYGGITEMLQMIVFTERTADVMDFLANSIGCILGIGFFRIIFGKRKLV